MFSWSNSPLLVLLQFVDPNMLFGNEETSVTLLHDSVDLADSLDYSTHENQLNLAKQLTEHGTNVKAVSSIYGKMPLHMACFTGVVTNLDFVKLLLEACADPNAQDQTGLTPQKILRPTVYRYKCSRTNIVRCAP
jgi:ankyrin repeat protein